MDEPGFEDWCARQDGDSAPIDRTRMAKAMRIIRKPLADYRRKRAAEQ